MEMLDPLGEGGSFPSGGVSVSDVLRGGGGSPPFDPSLVGDPGSMGGGFQDWLKGVGSDLGGMGAKDWVNVLGKGLQLGTAGVGIASGVAGIQRGAEQNKMLRQAQREERQIAAPAAAFGTEMLGAGRTGLLTGALPPGLEAEVQTWKQKARSQIMSYLVHIGQGDSSAVKQYDAWLDQQEAVLREQLAGTLAQQGMTGITTALGPLREVSGTAGKQTDSIQGLLAEANRALGLLTGATGSTDEEQRRRARAA